MADQRDQRVEGKATEIRVDGPCGAFMWCRRQTRTLFRDGDAEYDGEVEWVLYVKEIRVDEPVGVNECDAGGEGGDMNIIEEWWFRWLSGCGKVGRNQL